MAAFDDPVAAAASLWALVGSALALVFLAVGIDRIDPAARGAYAVRALLFPGLVLLWPVVAWRWWVLDRRGAGR